MLFIENRHLSIMIIGDQIKNEVLALLLLGFGSSLISLPVASCLVFVGAVAQWVINGQVVPWVSMAI
ncbi:MULTISPECIES: hypothetical protein [Pseudomonas]|uniref:hypothetical protein n=1 Tax=Pseudomonas TaxID=286 RepID=UPI0003B44F6C|nr:MULTISPECIES: hypothetical protein [Pseudomonas]ERO64213.1 hypothetical protein P308_25245 [Pseudomonas piscis]